ncbi:hypothetical protein GCM10027047_13540 [Rhodococcus aerolatus]
MTLEPLLRHRALTTPAVGVERLAAADGLGDRLAGVAATLQDTGRDLGAAWSGLAADAAGRARARRAAEVSALTDDAGALVLLLAAVLEAQHRARVDADRVLAVWWATAVVWPAWAPVAVVAGRWACSALERVGDTLRRDLERVARELDGLFPGRVGGDQAGLLVPRVVDDRGLAAVVVPPAGTSPAAVAAWWARVGPLDLSTLDAGALDALAQRPGLPPAVLDAVNRRRLDRDTRLAGTVGDRARAVWATLDEAMAAAADPPLGPVLLLGYSPDGPGRVAVSFGDPSVADTVAVTVPGTSNAPGSPGLTDQAVALRRALDADAPGTRSATVTWLGYDAPDSLTDPDVTSPAGARDGAPRLVADVAGWAAAADAAGVTGQRVTALGHSYGSTVVGLAAAQGLAVDDVVLVGSPGAGVASADGLGVAPGHVWVGATEHDPVVEASGGRWFSPAGPGTGVYDPGFGARRFATPSEAGLTSAHSGYYAPGSPSLANLSAITRGAPAEVTGPGLLDSPAAADPRAALLDLLTDPARGRVSALLDGDPAGAVTGAAGALAGTLADVLDAGVGEVGRGAVALGTALGLR